MLPKQRHALFLHLSFTSHIVVIIRTYSYIHQPNQQLSTHTLRQHPAGHVQASGGAQGARPAAGAAAGGQLRHCHSSTGSQAGPGRALTLEAHAAQRVQQHAAAHTHEVRRCYERKRLCCIAVVVVILAMLRAFFLCKHALYACVPAACR
jgi:hypothetical protein